MGDYNSTLNNIKEGLEILGISCSLEAISNVEDVSIIINSYSPDNNSRPISLAFSVNNNISFNPKCWLTENNLKEVNGRSIPYHSVYKRFSYKDKEFYPFSVNLSDYQVSTDDIKKLCFQLYRHVKQLDFIDAIKSREGSGVFESTQEINDFIKELRK